jgi:hypothetical protein
VKLAGKEWVAHRSQAAVEADREPELAGSEADHGPQERGVRPVR